MVDVNGMLQGVGLTFAMVIVAAVLAVKLMGRWFQ
jgi:hypothetical protein